MPAPRPDFYADLAVGPQGLSGVLYDSLLSDGGLCPVTPAGDPITPPNTAAWIDARTWPWIGVWICAWSVVGEGVQDVGFSALGEVNPPSDWGVGLWSYTFPAPLGTPAGEWCPLHFLPGWPAFVPDRRLGGGAVAAPGSTGCTVRTVLIGRRDYAR